MHVFHHTEFLQAHLAAERAVHKSIGFVPTMGALHSGHLSLVERAFSECSCVVVSIFVNPTQFTNASDLATYPRDLEADLDALSPFENVVVFAPSADQIYPETDHFSPLNFRGLDAVLEGEFRPGHFQGVAHVVRNLFQIIEPQKAYFGLKDFQQVAIIRFLTKELGFPIEIIACETAREENGLAKSSRNSRLSETDKSNAAIIYQTLLFVRANKPLHSPADVREKAITFFETGKLRLEHLEIVDSNSLKILGEEWRESSTCCIAAFSGDVRLIDNLQL